MRTRHARGESGFSLIELMVVIAIIAMLAAIVGYNVLGSLKKGESAAAKQQIVQLKSALIGYRLEFKKFPSSEEGLEALVNNGKHNFLDQKAVPKDPWGNPFVYRLESNGEFVIVSYGADGQEGGTGENSDISSDALGADENDGAS